MQGEKADHFMADDESFALLRMIE